MKGIFCISAATTNEEYCKVLKSRLIIMIIITVVGIIMAATAFWAEQAGISAITDHMLGIYSGCGMGLAFAGIIMFIMNYTTMKNEDKLKQSRLKYSDERLLAIGSKALRTATMIMIASFYAVALIGGIFYPVLVKLLLIVMSIFVGAYFISYRVYQSKM